MDFFLKNNYVENSLICPKDKSENHCPTELFPIYPDNHWTIRRRDNHIVVPSSNRIKLKIDWFLFSVCCLSEVCNLQKIHLFIDDNFGNFWVIARQFCGKFWWKILGSISMTISGTCKHFIMSTEFDENLSQWS